MKDRYHALRQQIAALTEGETDDIARMATMACELYHHFGHFDWVGFYRNMGQETLKIGPYQGGHGCLTIPFSRGVCGASARTGKTIIVPDVEEFADHIACASSTRSEIVVPVWSPSGDLLAVLDIDSDTPDAFDAEDAAALEAILAATFGGSAS